VITQQARRLQRLVAQLLDVSRVQSDRLVVELQPIDLCRVLEEIAEDIRPTLHEHSLVLHYPSRPIHVLGDELRLGQVFHNLIANAIKYSPDGGVVRVELTTSATLAIVQVSDSGIGIPIEAQQHLFERFYRAPNAEALRVEGMGIGLFVVREIVQRHGGSITVVSAEGQGSRFTVHLPLSLSTVVADQIDQNGVEQES
jgi:signal transduction histidine kinase